MILYEIIKVLEAFFCGAPNLLLDKELLTRRDMMRAWSDTYVDLYFTKEFVSGPFPSVQFP